MARIQGMENVVKGFAENGTLSLCNSAVTVKMLPPVLPVCTVPCAQHAEVGLGLNTSRTLQDSSGSTPT